MSKLEPFFRELWPAATPALVKESAARFPELANEFGYTKQAQVSGLFGNIGVESTRGKNLVENLNYSAERLVEVFHMSLATARKIEHNQQAIAMQVYGQGSTAKTLGNLTPQDGWTFRGNGLGQTTGRYNHTVLAKRIGIDVVNHPEILRAPETALKCTMANYTALGFPKAVLISFHNGVGVINSAHLHESDRLSEANRADKLINKYNVMKYVANPSLNDQPGDPDIVAPNKPKLGLVGKPIALIGDIETDAPSDHVVVVSNDSNTVEETNVAQVAKVQTPIAASVAPVIIPESMSKDRVSMDMTGDPILAQIGDEDDENSTRIHDMQVRLNTLSCFCTVDGKYGDRTGSAMFLFESNNGLVTDGKLSQKDWDLLQLPEAKSATVSEARANATVKEVIVESKAAKSNFNIIGIVKKAVGTFLGIQVADGAGVGDYVKSGLDNFDTLKDTTDKVSTVTSFLFRSPLGLTLIMVCILVTVGYYAKKALDARLEDKRSGKVV